MHNPLFSEIGIAGRGERQEMGEDHSACREILDWTGLISVLQRRIWQII